MFLTDTHCHLDFHAFDEDREAVISRAVEQGVTRIINPGIDIETSHRAIELAERYPQVYAAVGIHPNDANSWEKDSQDHLRSLAAHPKVVAIGEIGLDYYRQHAPHDLQQHIFQIQFKLAASLGKPVIIHCREAAEDMLTFLEEIHTYSGAGIPSGVLHSFSGDKSFAQAAIRLGFYIGITGPVTFKNAQNLQDLVKSLPLDQLLIETDAPFLTPHPKRGQRNEPGHVRLTAEKIAELKGMSLATVATATSQNASKLFNWRN